MLFTQVLNLNIERPNNLKVRHRVTFDYVRDADLNEPMKPLFNLGASGMVQLTNNPLALTTMMGGAPLPSAATAGEGAGAPHGSASCLIGSRAPQAAASSADYVDPSGKHMTGHWIVPPGRQVNASDITWFLDTTGDARKRQETPPCVEQFLCSTIQKGNLQRHNRRENNRVLFRKHAEEEKSCSQTYAAMPEH